MTKRKTKNLRPGPRPGHGGYSFLRTGVLPKRKNYIERYLTMIREGYIQDLGPRETDLSTGQRVLLDKLITVMGIARLIEEGCRAKGSLTGLTERYQSFNNLIVKICMALGIERKEPGHKLSPAELAKEIDEGDRGSFL